MPPLSCCRRSHGHSPDPRPWQQQGGHRQVLAVLEQPSSSLRPPWVAETALNSPCPCHSWGQPCSTCS